MERGHKVIVITRNYGDRKGIRYLSNGLKVYYLPIPIIGKSLTFISGFLLFPILRKIWIRERIDIIHAHQVKSFLQFEHLKALLRVAAHSVESQ